MTKYKQKSWVNKVKIKEHSKISNIDQIKLHQVRNRNVLYLRYIVYVNKEK